MSDTPRKDAISAQIDTLLASGKTQKISAYDHRTVATSIVNYIDNRILTQVLLLLAVGQIEMPTGI